MGFRGEGPGVRGSRFASWQDPRGFAGPLTPYPSPRKSIPLRGSIAPGRGGFACAILFHFRNFIFLRDRLQSGARRAQIPARGRLDRRFARDRDP